MYTFLSGVPRCRNSALYRSYTSIYLPPMVLTKFEWWPWPAVFFVRFNGDGDVDWVYTTLMSLVGLCVLPMLVCAVPRAISFVLSKRNASSCPSELAPVDTAAVLV